jgi:Ca2+-binding RTX toxin-like protein
VNGDLDDIIDTQGDSIISNGPNGTGYVTHNILNSNGGSDELRGNGGDDLLYGDAYIASTAAVSEIYATEAVTNQFIANDALDYDNVINNTNKIYRSIVNENDNSQILSIIGCTAEESDEATAYLQKMSSLTMQVIDRINKQEKISLNNMASNPVIATDAAEIIVDIIVGTDFDDEYLKILEELGLKNPARSHNLVSGRIAIKDIYHVLSDAQVLSMSYSPYSTSAGSVASGAEGALGSATVNALGYTGDGVHVGVLSDSYNYLGGAATDKASGDLPAVVTVLEDDGTTDEGRAMLQIVHDIAPDSSLSFATAWGGMANFADNILALADNGADVIVDDVEYFAELTFVDDLISQAIEAVSADGSIYLTSNGNGEDDGIIDRGGVYRPVIWNCNNLSLLDFNPTTENTVELLSFTAQQTGTTVLRLTWSSPAPSVHGIKASSDLDLYVLDANMQQILAYADSDQGNQMIDPVEIILMNVVAGTTYRLFINKYSGITPEFVQVNRASGADILFYADGIDEFSNSYGHALSKSALSVGAVYYQNSPATGGSGSIESFSSYGKGYKTHDASGNQLATPEVRYGAELSGVDGLNTTFFGSDSDSDGNPNFFGTSAAAPSVAAVVALMLEKDPSLTLDEIRTILQTTAYDIDAPGFDLVSGAGLVNAERAISAIGSGSSLFEGDDTDNTIEGSDGNDTLIGNGGSDYLYGKEGDDLLYGDAETTVTTVSEATVVTISSVSQTANAGLPRQENNYQPAIVVPTDPEDPDFVVPVGQYDGVVYAIYDADPNDGLIRVGSGSLLWDGKHILTAAHVVCADSAETSVSPDKLTFEFRLLEGGTVSIKAKTIYVHPDYDIEEDSGGYLTAVDNDIAVIELQSEAPIAADRYQIYRNNDEKDKLVTHVGYGRTGTGTDGVDAGYPIGIARYGDNSYDLRSGDVSGGFLGTDNGVVLYDFDDGTSTNDFFGNALGIHHTGVGDREVIIAGGDSGGPGFIDAQVAGVHSFGNEPAYGSLAGDTRVAEYATWIDGIMGYSVTNHDYLNGGEGNDTLFGGAGDDTLSGGSDLDWAIYSGNRTEYAINLDPETSLYTLSDSVADRDGTDLVGGVEKFWFADTGWLDFSADEIAPTIIGYAPVDGAQNTALESNIVLTFSEAILQGTGTIAIRKDSPTGDIVENIDVATSNRLAISGTTLTIDPAADFVANTHYVVTFAVGTITDFAGNNFTETTIYDFTTIGSGSSAIEGDDTNNILNGTSDNDTIIGKGGTDVLRGNAGNDFLYGDAHIVPTGASELIRAETETTIQQEPIGTLAPPTAHDPAIIVPIDPYDPDFLIPAGQYDGTVYVISSQGWVGSGSLLWDGKHIITAAHVVCQDGTETPVSPDTLTFEFRLLDGGTVSIKAKTVHVNPNYDVAAGYDNDVAVVELETEAPANADRYQIYRDNDEIGKLVTHAGYGTTGTGESGTDMNYPVGIARYGDNTYDLRSGDVDDEWGADDGCLLYDFDDGTAQNYLFGNALGIHHTGVGEREINISGGDSGGPAFIDGKIAGVHSWGLTPPGNTWGAYAGDTRVSFYAPWIDSIAGIPQSDELYGGEGSDTLYGQEGSDTLDGGTGSDSLDGGAGNDALLFDALDTQTDGGTGTDTLTIKDTTPVDLSALIGTVRNIEIIDLRGNGAQKLHTITAVAAQALTGTAELIILGDNLDKTLLTQEWSAVNGNFTIAAYPGLSFTKHQAAAQTIYIQTQIQLIEGLDTPLEGTDTADTLTGGDRDSIINGRGGNDILYGNKGNDTLDGGTGNDTLDGGTGTDSMAGGAGDDLYNVDSIGDTVTEQPSDGNDTVHASVTFRLSDNIENLHLTGEGLIHATGNALANKLTGNDKDNILLGLGGNDTLQAGAGNDTADGGAGNDLIHGENGSDRLYGGAGSDTILGGSGNDYLYGGKGDDTLSGGSGLDAVIFSGNQADYTINFDEPTACYIVSDSIANRDGTDLLGGIEKFRFADTGWIDYPADITEPTVTAYTPAVGATNVAVGSNLVLTFSEAILQGAGTIAIRQETATGTIIESFNAATSDRLTISGTTLTIDPTADLASSNHYVVTLAAGAITDYSGNDFSGTSSYDFTTEYIMVGGTAESWLYLASWPDLMAAFGADSYAAAWHYNIYGKNEGRTLTFDAWGYLASWADLRGVFGSNLGAAAEHYVEYGRNEGRTLTFDAWKYLASWDDLLNAFGSDPGAATRHYVTYGANEGRTLTFDALGYLLSYDDLRGAFGTDTHAATWHYVNYGYHEGRHLVSVDGAPVVASFSPVDGAIGVSLDSTIVLTFNESIHRGTGSIELHIGSPAGGLVESYDVATSTHLAVSGTTLTINPTADLARGIQYFVTITAGAIKDLSGNSYAGTTSYDFISDPNLIGTDGMDMLHGGNGNETISGLGGPDTLNGGAGADLLIGGAGNDRFVFSNASDIGLAAGSRDVISDFTSGQDKIDLSGIDANTITAGDQAFSGPLLGGSGVFSSAGQLRYDSAAGVLYGNTDSDADAEFAIELIGALTLEVADLVL